MVKAGGDDNPYRPKQEGAVAGTYSLSGAKRYGADTRAYSFLAAALAVQRTAIRGLPLRLIRPSAETPTRYRVLSHSRVALIVSAYFTWV